MNVSACLFAATAGGANGFCIWLILSFHTYTVAADYFCHFPYIRPQQVSLFHSALHATKRRWCWHSQSDFVSITLAMWEKQFDWNDGFI